MVKATAVNARLGYRASGWTTSRSAINGRAVVAEISEATKMTISSAGSARKPIIMSRRAPSVPNAVPMSIAASDMKTRAIASSPTSAIASAAERKGRPVPIEGMTAAAATIAPNTTYGARRNSGDALSAITASLWNSLRMPWYGSSTLGARRFCSQARHALTQPRNSGARTSAASTSRNCVSQPTALTASPRAAPRA